ncbi:hypothetical protein E4U14_002927 [Claviceps sp. LM454 group G7]|nr:hypothetical protein E4U14_002927 [Claviceps sp. LM454 group G7]
MVRLAKWSWLALLIPLHSPVEGRHLLSTASALDSTPRAALVTLAHENDLEPLLSSMSQLEDSFNNRYKYDWVFFGVETLSERFRQLTSNATAATCIYEVACQNIVDPRRFNNVCHSQAGSTRTYTAQTPSPTRGDLSESMQSIRQIQRWNNGPFAKEKRLQTYDWFWRIEPGWPLRRSDQTVVEETVSSPAEAFTSWLRTFGALSDMPKFEIGSLGFFRSYSHQVLLEHFDESGSQHDEGLRDILVPSISASIFLPQKSVWNFRQKNRSLPHPPDSTPQPKLKLWHLMRKTAQHDVRAKPTRYISTPRTETDALKEQFAIWDVIAEEFDRRDATPGLRSGNTVIDERNFALGRHGHRRAEG